MYGIDTYSSDLVGLIGVPVNIETDSEFDEATVVFTYDKNELGETNENDLGILWYDVENGCYEKMDSVVDKENCTITFKTTHFSEYMAYDKEQYDKLFEENSEADHGNDIWQGKVITPHEFLDMVEGFDINLSDLTAMSNGMSLYVTKIRSHYNMVEEDNTLTGEYFITSNYMMYKPELTHIRYYNVLGALVLGNDDNGSLTLFPLEYTGTYRINWRPRFPYYADVNEDDPGEVEILEKCYIPAYYFDSTDSDNDGLLDVNEAQGLRLTNGVQLFTDFEISDMDGDGKLDGQEVIRCDVKHGYFYMLSDPKSVDSDGDGYDDDIDPEPMYVNDFEEVIEIIDWCYYEKERECTIKFAMGTMPGAIWKDTKVKIEFDNPKLPLFINNTTSNVIELGNVYGTSGINAEWDFKLSNETLFKNVGYTITLTANGQDFYSTHRYMTEKEYSTAKVYVKKGDLDKDNNYPITVKVTGQTNQKVFATIKDADGNVVITYKAKGNKEAQDCEFSAVLDGNKIYSVEVIVNKGMENEYRYNDGVSVGNKYVDTDGDSYYDFEDRYPYTRAINGSIFQKVPKDYYPDYLSLLNEKKESEAVYADEEYIKELNNTYREVFVDEIPMIVSEMQYLNSIYEQAVVVSLSKYILKDGGGPLAHFLTNVGSDYELDVWSLINLSYEGKYSYEINIERLQYHIESVLNDGDSIIIGNIKPLVIYDKFRLETNGNKLTRATDLNWFAGIGDCKNGAILGVAERKGNNYSVYFTYIVSDFYDWEKGSIATLYLE